MFRYKTMIGAAALLLSLTVVLSACGSNADGNRSSQSGGTQSLSSSAQSASEAEKGEMRTFKDSLNREVVIPVRPQRVVALAFVGEMLALGQKPIGATDQLLRFFSAEEKQGIANIAVDTASKEAVLALNPDLILVSARMAPEEIEAYSKIAPVVAVPFFGDAFESLHLAADILGKEQEEKAWIERYETKAKQLQDKVKPMFKEGETGVVIQFALKQIYTYRTSTFPTVYQVLGLIPPKKLQELEQQENFKGVVPLAEEVLPEFAADRIFVIVNDEESQQTFEDAKKGAVWKNLPAVQNNQVYVIDKRLSIADASTLDWAFDEVERLLLK